MTPPMMMPKQNPVNPAPLINPVSSPVKLKAFTQSLKMPPRMAAPTPAARMAMNPARRSRLAFGAIPFAFPLLIVLFGRFGFDRKCCVLLDGRDDPARARNNLFRLVAAARFVVEPDHAKNQQQDGRQYGHHAKGLLGGGSKNGVEAVPGQGLEGLFTAGHFDLGSVKDASHPRQNKFDR